MSGNPGETSDFYAELFTEDPYYGTPYPNLDEARRWAKICEFLSQIPRPDVHGIGQRLRILDVGCGNGWLTYLANIYGRCEGVDPSAGSIEQARRYFPGLTFYVGTASAVLRSPTFEPYDVVITSEVIEHIRNKEGFIADIRKCLAPRGHIILTTPRGERFARYAQGGFKLQPIEEWISEKELFLLFKRNRFVPIQHDRVYMPIPGMSSLQDVYENPKVSRMLDSLRLTWVHKAVQYQLGIYQAWWFRLKQSESAAS